MPTDSSRRPSPEDLDPEQTLFFKRRKKHVKFLPLIVVCALLLGSGAMVVWAVSQVGKHNVEELAHAATPNPFANRPMVAPGDARNAENPVVYSPPTPGITARSTPAPAPAAPRPVVADGDAPLNFSVDDPDNAEVRTEVLRRIDLMPGVSAADKDKLYASVDHARGMGRVKTISFEKGDTAVRPGDVEKLRAGLATPQIKKLVDDPTVVFVVLGYADQGGNEKTNTEVSLSRAKSVLDTLRNKLGFRNVMHAVAMGGSTLFSAQQAEKNRVVEIWAVLP